MGTKQRMGNEVTDRPMVQVRFCSYFSFPVPRARFPFLVLRSPFPVPRLSNTPLFPGIHSSRPPDSREKRSLVVGKTKWQADVKLQRLYEETDVNSFCERSVLKKY